MKMRRITVRGYLKNPTPEAYARMIEQIATDWQTSERGALARDALRAIGMPLPKLTSKKK